MTGDQLRDWRQKRGWDISRAAVKFRVAERIWTRWENRSQPVPPFVVGAIDRVEEVDRLRARLDQLQSGVLELTLSR